MFKSYNASIWHVVGMLLLGALFGTLSVGFPAAGVVFFTLFVVCVLACLAILVVMIWEQSESHLATLGKSAVSINEMAPDRFIALGISLPKVRATWTGSEAILYFDDTDVPMLYFKMFMDGSDKQQIFPERDCREGGMPLGFWKMIRLNLESRGLVIERSAAGSHSWLWRQDVSYKLVYNHYQKWFNFSVHEHVSEQ